MKKIIITGITVFAVALLAPQIAQAQGTVYVSNLGQSSAGSVAVGSNSWFAVGFITGTNIGGYLLDSVQLALTDASGNPSSFMAMLYAVGHSAGASPGSSLGTLNGSANPGVGGIYTYMPTSDFALSPNTDYFLVLTAGTAVSNGAYSWSYAGAKSYNPTGGWSDVGGVWPSSDGSHWNAPPAIYPQFAISATAIPEPGVLSLFGLGGLFLFGIFYRRYHPRIGSR